MKEVVEDDQESEEDDRDNIEAIVRMYAADSQARAKRQNRRVRQRENMRQKSYKTKV